MSEETNIINDLEEISLPSSDGEDSFIVDESICSAYEIEQSFQQKYKIIDEYAVSLKKDYILNLCSDSSFSCIAAGFSNGSVQIFNINASGLSLLSTINETPSKVCGVCFLDETPNNLLIGTVDGLVRLYDVRNGMEQARFKDSGAKSIAAFDSNSNSRIICAGTDQIQNNVYLLFYDVRQRQKLGEYTESHNDDVTTVCFHDVDPDLLCSGSTDGLINIFNIAEETEDDALLMTINTNSSVHKLNWHKDVYEKNIISCITHTNDYQVYECEEGDALAEFERTHITEAIKRKAPANCNLIGSHSMSDGSVFLLAGTNFNKGEIMRSLRLQNKQLLPLANFVGNKQIVRESIFDAKSNTLITAGESGIITLWTVEQAATALSSNLKTKTKLKSKKGTPY